MAYKEKIASPFLCFTLDEVESAELWFELNRLEVGEIINETNFVIKRIK